MPSVKPTIRRHLLVLAIYTVLGLILTYPMARHFGTHVPGDGIDDPALAWNLWWVKFALVDRQINPFHCGWMFHPIGINLAFYTLTILNGLLSVPLQLAFGLVPASNLLLLSSFVLSGYGAYLLTQYVLAEQIQSSKFKVQSSKLKAQSSKSKAQIASCLLPLASCLLPLASFFAGLIYAFSSCKLFYASLGQFNVASSQWIPFAVLYVLRAGRDRRLRDAGLAALFLLCQAYAELTFASFLLIFIALYVLYELIRETLTGHGSRITHYALRFRSFFRNLLVLAILFLLGVIPFLANMLPDLRTEGDFFTSGGGFADVFSADLAGYLWPTQLHPLLGRLAAMLPFPHDKGQHLYLGYSVMLLAAWGLWRGRRSPAVRFWALSALVFFLFTLGPTLRINGQDTGIPGPFALISELPFFKGNRYPSRYSVMLVLSCAVLAGFGLMELFQSSAVRRTTPQELSYIPIASALVALFLFEHLSIPLPLSDLRVPAVYERLAAEPGDFAVLELPIGWRNGARVLGQQDVIIMFEQWYQTAHGQRLLGGNTSRNPEFKFQYFAQAPLLNSLIAVQNGHQIPPEVEAMDRALAAEVLRFLGVRYVVLHEPPASPALRAYAEKTLPVEPVAAEQGVCLYRVAWPPSAAAPIDLSTPLGRLHLGEGWSPVTDNVQGEAAVWAQRREVRLLATLLGDERRLRFRAWVPSSGQVVEVWARGRRWAALTLAAGWGEYEVVLPAGAVQPGLNDFRLRFAQLYPLADIPVSGMSGTEVAGQTITPAIVVQSAGLETGGNDLGHIYVNGRDLSPNRRGYNIVALDSVGRVLASGSFDTHLDPQASPRLADFIAGLPEGSIVAVAVADEASLNLGAEAVSALESIGATGDLRGRFRWGHAVIGVKGAAPGQALEALDVLQPVAVHVGLGATSPAVAMAFASFQFGPLP
ncbi:MAG: interleukin-like EMT inducer domain-containing protein [Anaerolineae bacterium]|nr:interleukin-like EMT inducer domain-containing protein [Anaerolineae bacterium]